MSYRRDELPILLGEKQAGAVEVLSVCLRTNTARINL